MRDGPAADRRPMKSPQRARLWCFVPIVLTGVIVLTVLGAMRARRGEVTVDEIVAEIYAVALSRSEREGVEDGGPIGPWWVAATRVDAERGLLLDFRLRSADLRVAARSARVVVDPDADTFGFELRDAVLTRFPERESDGERVGLLTVERHHLGPVHEGRDIVEQRTP